MAVRSFHRFCVDEGLVEQDPSEEVGAPRVPQGLPKALTEPEVEALLDAVEGDDPRALRDRAILETLYATGVRISELVGLDRADLDLEEGLARVLGKGSKERVVPVGRSARARDRRLPDPRSAPPGAAGDPEGPGRPALAQRARRTSVAPELLDDRDRRGRPGRTRRPPLDPGVTATDVVLTVTDMLRKHGVVGKFVEFYGKGVAEVPLANRATLGNMSPEFGSTAAIFPIDDVTIDYLRLTGLATTSSRWSRRTPKSKECGTASIRVGLSTSPCTRSTSSSTSVTWCRRSRARSARRTASC